MWAIALLHCRQDQSANVGFCLLRELRRQASSTQAPPRANQGTHDGAGHHKTTRTQSDPHIAHQNGRMQALFPLKGRYLWGGVMLLSADRPRMDLTPTRRRLTSHVRRNQTLRLDDGCGHSASRQQGRGKWIQQVPPHDRTCRAGLCTLLPTVYFYCIYYSDIFLAERLKGKGHLPQRQKNETWPSCLVRTESVPPVQRSAVLISKVQRGHGQRQKRTPDVSKRQTSCTRRGPLTEDAVNGKARWAGRTCGIAGLVPSSTVSSRTVLRRGQVAEAADAPIRRLVHTQS